MDDVEILHRISHDMRTPVNAIIGYSSLLGESCLEPEQVRSYAEKINWSGRLLGGMISEILEVAALERGKCRPVNECFEPVRVVRQVDAVIRPLAEGRNQRFTWRLSNFSDDLVVLGDGMRFGRILMNILSNSVKYTPEGGGITLDLKMHKRRSEELIIAAVVKDNGCGMSRAFLERIFCPFERERCAGNENTGGTGLGMTIVKSFVDSMGGRIYVDSEVGIGTEVTVVIPFGCPAAGQAEYTAVDPRKLDGMHFLVAEDNEINGDIIKELLHRAGAGCSIVRDGTLAVEAFAGSETGMYDMILMDIQMPVMDGHSAAAAIRSSSHPQAMHIPIIAMTANAFEEDERRAFASGMDGHITKPVNFDRLVTLILEIKKSRGR